MKHKASVETLLRTYEIAQPDETKIRACIQQVEEIMKTEQKENGKDLRFFLETQLRFMRGEIVLSFVFSIGLMILMQMFNLFPNGNTAMGAVVGTAPFLVVPVIFSVVKSNSYGMMELEMASKWGIEKIIATRLFGNQVIALLVITILWLIASAGEQIFQLQWLFFAILSFEVTTICFLWFGKSSLKGGLCWTMGWVGVLLFVLSRKETFQFIEKVSSIAMFVLVLGMIGMSIFAGIRYIQRVSMEREEMKWNLSWID